MSGEQDREALRRQLTDRLAADAGGLAGRLRKERAAGRQEAFHDLMTYWNERQWFRLAEELRDALLYIEDGPAQIGGHHD